ncbi:MAG: hypothetical protein F6K04_06965 [Leptolyngbya sp. SIO4C5]|nr:hypothetical protein [Leptolyngbya sp. SIO4C5]
MDAVDCFGSKVIMPRADSAAQNPQAVLSLADTRKPRLVEARDSQAGFSVVLVDASATWEILG